MADNVVLNAGTGGATMRTYADSSGVEHPAAVAVYLTTVADGANVVQEVTPSAGLPVAQQGTWTVQPGDTANTTPWLMSISQGGNTAAVDASGRLTVNAVQSGSFTTALAAGQTLATLDTITNPVAVVQDTPADLQVLASIAAGQSIDVGTVGSIAGTVAVTQSGSWSFDISSATVVQSDPALLKATVNIAAGQSIDVGSVSGTVAVTQSGAWSFDISSATVTQSDPALLKATVNIAAGQSINVGTVSGTVTVAQATASNLLCTASQGGTWTVGLTAGQSVNVGTVSGTVAVSQATASNLKATVDISSGQSVGLSAGTNLVGKVAAAHDTATIYSGTTALTPKFAKITASSSGDTSVVALVSGKKIRVLRFSASSNSAVNIKFRSNTTDVTGLYYLTQYASAGGAYCPVGIFETAVGEALQINLSGAGAVGGVLTYIEV